jgi:hypothetical protein
MDELELLEVVSTTSVWDDLETLVFDRDDVRAAVNAALGRLPESDDDIPIDAASFEKASEEDDDRWLASLPASAFDVLMQVSQKRPAHAPRLSFAVAQPA